MYMRERERKREGEREGVGGWGVGREGVSERETIIYIFFCDKILV